MCDGKAVEGQWQVKERQCKVEEKAVEGQGKAVRTTSCSVNGTKSSCAASPAVPSCLRGRTNRGDEGHLMLRERVALQSEVIRAMFRIA